MALPFLGAGPLGEQPSSPDATDRQVVTEEHRNQHGHLWNTESYYRNSSGGKVMHGPSTYWHENGTPHIRSEYHNGKPDGTLTEWNEKGDKIREERYVDGKPSGLWQTWDWHGTKRSECTYREGRIIGAEQFWDMEGKLSLEYSYDKNGNLEASTEWYPNGKKRSYGRFQPPSLTRRVTRSLAGESPTLEPERNGLWTYWEKNGAVVAQGTWKNGKPWDGICVDHERGRRSIGPERFGRYENGKLIEYIPDPFDRGPGGMPDWDMPMMMR